MESKLAHFTYLQSLRIFFDGLFPKLHSYLHSARLFNPGDITVLRYLMSSWETFPDGYSTQSSPKARSGSGHLTFLRPAKAGARRRLGRTFRQARKQAQQRPPNRTRNSHMKDNGGASFCGRTSFDRVFLSHIPQYKEVQKEGNQLMKI
jgi:hypothetical protein